MYLIKSDVRSHSPISKYYIIDIFYNEMQNIIDVLNISNDLYIFIYNYFLISKKKSLFLYIIFNIEKIFLTKNKLIQLINNKKKNITYIFIECLYKKKKWVRINIITAMPLSNSLEEYLLKFFQKRYDNRKFFFQKKVNKNIIGGLILRIEDKEWDRSLGESLRKLRVHY